jgi:hypothetical protein
MFEEAKSDILSYTIGKHLSFRVNYLIMKRYPAQRDFGKMYFKDEYCESITHVII